MDSRRLYRKALYLTALAASAFALPAQNVYLERIGGTLGNPLTVKVKGTSVNTIFILIPSFNRGPTPLSFIDSSDPRKLGIGLELAQSIFIVGVPTKAGVDIPFPMPSNPTFHGINLYFQAFTIPGQLYVIGALSNVITNTLGTADTWLDRGEAPKTQHAMGQVTDIGNGELLISGGYSGITDSFRNGTKNTGFFLKDELEFMAGRSMIVARALHTSINLGTGQVLMAGGSDDKGVVTKTCEVYDIPLTRFLPTGSMSFARAGHTATLLPNGRVLVVGGSASVTGVANFLNGIGKNTEIYNPRTSSWSAGPNLRNSRAGHSAVLLKDGRILIISGISTDSLNKPVTTTSCEIYDPKSNSIIRTDSLPISGTLGHRATLLQDGKVLLTGGFKVNGDMTQGSTQANAVVYDPVSAKWASVPSMRQARAFHTAVLQLNGKVLIAGGAVSTGFNYVTLDHGEVYDPSKQTWTAVGKTLSSRAFGMSLRLVNGQILNIGGSSGNPASNSVLKKTELYNAR